MHHINSYSSALYTDAYYDASVYSYIFYDSSIFSYEYISAYLSAYLSALLSEYISESGDASNISGIRNIFIRICINEFSDASNISSDSDSEIFSSDADAFSDSYYASPDSLNNMLLNMILLYELVFSSDASYYIL